MKAYVIHLPRATQREHHIAAQLAAARLDHVYVDTVDGRELTEDDYATLIDQEAVQRHPTWLTPGMLGASLSHLNAYRQIAQDGEAVALVLEDDVILPERFMRLVTQVGTVLRGREAALLYYRSVGRCCLTTRDTVAAGHTMKLLRILSPDRVSSAGAYVVTREAAIALRDFILPVRAGPDSWGFFCEHGALDSLRCVFPRAVSVRNDFKSSLDYLPPHSRRQQVATAIADRRVFPFYQLLAAKRTLRERSMSRFRVVD
jgi:hypothetical protein